MIRAVGLGITSIALAASPAKAQSSNSGRPGHGFATVGVIGAWGDPADPVSVIGQPTSRGHLLVSGAIFVAPRVGIGIETFPEHDTTVELADSASFISSENLHEKTALMVTARGRAFARSHFAIDGVFGVGALRQTRTITTQLREPDQPPKTTTTDNTSAAFSFGADAPISVVRHVVVIPQVRWYHLRRLGNSYSPQAILFPLDASGSLFAFGVTAGVTW